MDLTEILKDCPIGIELYSPIYGLGMLTKVTNRIHVKFPKEHNVKCFKPDGKVSEDGEIMLFPKGKTTWEGFQRPFVDGDIVTDIEGAIIIYQEITTSGYCGSFASLDHRNQFIPHYKAYLDYIRLSTDEEKEKLFQAIKDNDYKWNPETKTLEELIVPKFKVGDTIITKNGLQAHKIIGVTSEYYSLKVNGSIGILPVKDQDDWELVINGPNKFDPKTLQPFDKVLVRPFDDRPWIADFHSHYDVCRGQSVDTSGFCYYYCIPYNEDTKHLVGKMDTAPEFYRYWEE